MFGRTTFLVFSSIFYSVLSDPLIVNDCGSPEGDLLKLRSLSIKPQEIPIPGDITVSAEVTAYRDTLGAQLDLIVHIERYVGFLWVTVPCISDVGSCKYDACDLLSGFNKTGCPPQMAKNNVPCTCETIKAGTYSVKSETVSIPQLSGLWSWLASGDYKVDLKLHDRVTNKDVGCLHAEVTVVDPTACEGFLCSIFGGK